MPDTSQAIGGNAVSFEIKIKDACTLSSDKTITAREALALSNFPKKEAVVACRVNREQRPLSWELVMDSYIEFITTDSIEGIEVYTRTLAFLLTAAATRVLGGPAAPHAVDALLVFLRVAGARAERRGLRRAARRDAPHGGGGRADTPRGLPDRCGARDDVRARLQRQGGAAALRGGRTP